jgi:DNA-binding LacI/PurR family transcriptional regulator
MSSTRPKKVTLREVAAVAGVSPMTISRVLNQTTDSDRISEECATRVRAVAEQMGYVGGYHRRTIRNRRAESLGVSLEVNAPDSIRRPSSALANPFFGRVVHGVEQFTHSVGYNLSLVVPSEKQRASVRGVEQVRELRIDGLIMGPTGSRSENTRVLVESPDLPIAAVMPQVPTDLPSLTIDEEALVELLIGHLAALGHRKVLYLGWKDQRADSRLGRFRRLAAKHGLSEQLLTIDYPTYPNMDDDMRAIALRENVTTELEAYLSFRRRDFTAMMCFNDQMAIAAMRVLARRGIRVPADVSVTGIDNFDPEMQVTPLTTVDTQLREMGFRAAQLVHDMVEGGAEVRAKYRKMREVVAPRLFVRDTTAPASAV